jgi:hypothetical protein
MIVLLLRLFPLIKSSTTAIMRVFTVDEGGSLGFYQQGEPPICAYRALHVDASLDKTAL